MTAPGRREKRFQFSENTTLHPLEVFTEPEIQFGYSQPTLDPRDGLTLFGPLDIGPQFGVRAGVVGTTDGISLFRAWLKRIQGVLRDSSSQVARPPFFGFEAVFRTHLVTEPALVATIPAADLHFAAHLKDQHLRVYQTVELFTDAIQRAIRSEEASANVWFVIVPDYVYANCRPKSRIPLALQTQPSGSPLGAAFGKKLRLSPSMFEEENVAAIPYSYEVDFHHQLKARLLDALIPTQIVRESTLRAERVPGPRDVSTMQAAIAWNLSTAAFYKAGGRPWKMADVRDSVCYLGLVFKRALTDPDPRTACCAAQMFLDSGDGMVFKGAVGPWYTASKDTYHLTESAAAQVMQRALETFQMKWGPSPPRELFVHGRVEFNDEEWKGFTKVLPKETRLVGVQIRTENSFRLYRMGTRPVLRGSAHIVSDRLGYLWTRGFVPRLLTYPGREVPVPLRVFIARGDASIRTVMKDLLALTKLNYNACIFADGLPVTLRFADAVGEILTAGPDVGDNPLAFKYYI